MKRIHPLIWMGGIVLVIGVCLFALFRPRHWIFESEASLNAIAQALPANRAKWQANNTHDYDIDAKMFFPPGCEMTQDSATIHVRGDAIEGIDWHTNLPQGAIEAFYEQFCNAERVIPGGDLNLGIVISNINPADVFVSAEFDPDYGFIRKYVNEWYSGSMGDCCSHYELSNFKPISQ